MTNEGFPILYDTQVTGQDDVAAAYQPGALFIHRSGTGNTNMSLVQYVQLDNNGCSQGDALVQNYATLKNYSVKVSATTDQLTPVLRGIAAATIASQYFGFMIMSGYVEKANLSKTCASGDLLVISGSTAGYLSPGNSVGSVAAFWSATVGVSSALGTAPYGVVARSNNAHATTTTPLGSITLLGNLW